MLRASQIGSLVKEIVFPLVKSSRISKGRSKCRPRSIPRLEGLEGRSLLSYVFTNIDVSRSTDTAAFKINNAGQIVGSYKDTAGKQHGFLQSSSGFTTIDAPGYDQLQAQDINNSGQIVGLYANPSGGVYGGIAHGFILSGGTYTTIDPPGSPYTYAYGINDHGQIVGSYYPESISVPRGFSLTGGVFTTTDPPGSDHDNAAGVNNSGQIVGDYVKGGIDHGYLLSGGSYSTIDVPGSTGTGIGAINDIGQIVGSYYAGGAEHGFVLSGGVYTTIDPPGSTFTQPLGINASGQISGTYVDSQGKRHGFLATPFAITAITPVTPNPRTTPVSSVDVTFAGAIDLSTLTYADMSLTLNGNAVPLNGAVTTALVSSTTYRISGLDTFTASAGSYMLTVNGSGVKDLAGNAATGTVSTSWSTVLSYVDQSLLINQGFFARFGVNAGIAQSFKQVHDNITGASVQTHVNGTGTGSVIIQLYDALPSAGGHILASGTATNVSAGDLATVEFGYTPIAPETTYYLVFSGSNGNMGVASTDGLGGGTDLYPRGQGYHSNFTPILRDDINFKTFYSGSTSTFVKSDTTTKGTWRGNYGADGFNVSQDSSAIPAYATMTLAGASGHTWASSTADPRALLKGTLGSTDRIAGTWYSPTSMSFDVNITDGKAHQVSLYTLDWDNNGRNETIDVIDTASGKVLNSQTISGFQNGVYLAWTLTGDVTFKVTNNGSTNAVVSGFFFGGAPSTTGSSIFLKSDSTTQGAWKGNYGADGFNVSQDPSANNPLIPAYATVTIAGASGYAWASTTTDPRGLQKAAVTSTDRIAGTWYSSTYMTFDVNITDGKTHQVALYALDWDNNARNETIDVIDTATGVVLDTKTISGFQNGVYLAWTVGGDVTFRVTNNGSTNAVVSGLFFGSAPTSSGAAATFVKADATTRGAWKGTYGADGFNVSQDSSATNPSIPAYASMTIAGASNTTWVGSTTDSRALRKSAAGAVDAIAGCWYGSSYTIDLNLSGTAPHQVALYALDWDGKGRSERIDVIDPSTGAVLNTQTVSSFNGGTYLVWKLTGHVVLKVSLLTGPNAVVSGIFFDPGV